MSNRLSVHGAGREWAAFQLTTVDGRECVFIDKGEVEPFVSEDTALIEKVKAMIADALEVAANRTVPKPAATVPEGEVLMATPIEPTERRTRHRKGD